MKTDNLTQPETRVLITENMIDVSSEFSFLLTPDAGAIDVFVGTTRQWTRQRETVELVYECYQEMALSELRKLIAAASEQWPIKRACIVHRTGIVPVAEPSVFIGVATPHRAEAFEACRYLIDGLKQQVPIWKYEKYSDGLGEWVGAGSVPGKL